MNNIITISKGIIILLVVLVHSSVESFSNAYNYSFGVFSFFFFSGYCLKEKHITSPIPYIKRRFLYLWGVYVLCGLLFLLCHNIFTDFHFYENYYSPSDMLKKSTSIVLKMSGIDPLLGGFWFLKALLFSSVFCIIYLTIGRKLNYGKIYLIVGCIVGFVIGGLMMFKKVEIPIWRIDGLSFIAVSVFLFGYSMKNMVPFWDQKKFWIAGLAIQIIFSLFIPLTSFQSCTIFFVFCVFALSSPLVAMGISSEINKHNICRSLFIYIGNNTLQILIWHFLAFKLVSYTQIKFENRSITDLTQFPTIHNDSLEWIIVYFLAGISIPLVISFTTQRFMSIVKKIQNSSQNE